MAVNNSKGQITAQVNLDLGKKSGFNMDNSQFGTGRIGRLYATCCDYVYPTDNYKRDSSAVVNFKPLSVPLMTNMHVKQESFYTPMNILWTNFDKFISNGEKNDYNGVVPALSLSQMVSKFFEFVTPVGGDYPISATGFGIPAALYDYTEFEVNTGETLQEWAKIRPFIGIDLSARFDTAEATAIGTMPGAPTYRSMFRNFDFSMTPLGQYLISIQADDLYNHIEPLVKQIFNVIVDAISAEIDTPVLNPISNSTVATPRVLALFREVASYGILAGTYAEGRAYYSNNKYMDKIYKSLDAFIDVDGGLRYVPTATGFAVLRLLYEVYKPIFGLSSNLDMLNYNKLRYQDFLYSVILSLADVSTSTYSAIAGGTASDVILPTNRVNISLFTAVLSTKPQSVLPLRALYLIWFNNYRDQILETDAYELDLSDNAYDGLIAMLSPRVRCWHKDAFTTALDTPGTGNVGVTLNFKDSGLSNRDFYVSKVNNITDIDGNVFAVDNNNIVEISVGAEKYRLPSAFVSGINSIVDTGSLVGDVVGTAGFTLYQLDAAQRAQKFLQKALFYGNRIQDFLFTHWGANFLDSRLRLPELIQQSSDMVEMQQIVANNTIVTEQSTNIAGDKAGFAWAKDVAANVDHYIPEYGLVISLFSVVPDVVYSNSYDRHHSMLDFMDFPIPEFATLGLQAVYESEMSQIPVVLPVDGDLTDAIPVHGYQGMYYSDKSKFSNVHGELLDQDNAYVMDREFNIYDPDARPKLNYVFVHCYPKLDAFVVDNEWSDYFRFDVYHNQYVNRLLPVHSVYI